jgi:drug/metabolite transporter (DMT)-like permease
VTGARTSGGRRERDGLRRAAPALALGLFGVSWAATLVRLAEAPAVSVAFWRLVFSVLLLAPLLLASGQWRELRSLGRSDWVWLGLAGVFLAAHLVVWFLSLEYTSVASSTVLVTSHPLFVGLLSAVWIREPPTGREWAGIAVAVAGGVVVGWGDFRAGAAPLLGDLLALAGAVLTALYFVVGRRLRGRLGVWSYVVPVYVVAAVVAGAVAAARGTSLSGYEPSTWGFLAALAVGPMLMGHTSFNWALEHVRAYVVSVVVLLEPLGATVLAVLVLGRGEVPSWNTAAGGLTVLAGVWLSLRGRRARRGAAGAGRGRPTGPPAGPAGDVDPDERDAGGETA